MSHLTAVLDRHGLMWYNDGISTALLQTQWSNGRLAKSALFAVRLNLQIALLSEEKNRSDLYYHVKQWPTSQVQCGILAPYMNKTTACQC
jgi:hypothetical protein